MRAPSVSLRLAAVACLAVLLSACASAPQSRALLQAPPPSLPERAEVEDLPFYAQEAYYCGPAATAMALSWSGMEVDQHDMVSQVYTPGRSGTFRSDVTAAVRRNGRLAVPVESVPALLEELAAGHPVIVFQNLSLPVFPEWHFAVAKGYDLETGELVLHSGTRENHRVSLTTFEATWARGDHWGLAVLPPDRLPAHAGMLETARAASALERVKEYAAATTAYESILERWPESLPAAIGLGNALYAQGDTAGSAAALRLATDRHPEAAVAWHNLAVALEAEGEPGAARDAAEQAVALEDEPAYRETLARLR